MNYSAKDIKVNEMRTHLNQNRSFISEEMALQSPREAMGYSKHKEYMSWFGWGRKLVTVTNGLSDMPDEGKNWQELLFIEHLLCIHAALSAFSYNLSPHNPLRWALSPFYRRGDRLEEGKSRARYSQPVSEDVIRPAQVCL